MSFLTRGAFVGRIGAAAAGFGIPVKANAADNQVFEHAEGAVSLDGAWDFRLDTEPGWSSVTVPHTWQIDPARANYTGAAWYRRTFEAPQGWRERSVRVHFDGVYHSAAAWLNGREIGSHLGKGYTSFAFDCDPALRAGTNELLIRVDNAFSDTMLPRNRSFDWTNDGGITRPVRLLVTPKVYIERIGVDARADAAAKQAELHVTLHLRNASGKDAYASIAWQAAEEGAQRAALSREEPRVLVKRGSTLEVRLKPALLREVTLWHFDRPHLYRLTARIQSRCGAHESSTAFGARSIELRGTAIYLNGERVRLIGMERTGGSNPLYGMAEPESLLVHDHDDMKNLNAVFTRVHWQQDPRVLEYCDRHGILVQEEIPAWGPDTFAGMHGEPRADIMENGLQQLRETIERDKNHPCIFSWGLCNEVDGKNPPAAAFIKRMYAEAKRLDPQRPVSYASNTLYEDPGSDAAAGMDFIEWNQYYQSWAGGTLPDIGKALERIHAAFPEKPIVISEYGYCECKPQFNGGDEERREIIRTHTQAYRKYDYVAGAIFFDYSDYRTHMGDKGVAPLKQRVHGVVDLYGRRKASYPVLRDELSPIESLEIVRDGAALFAHLKTRDTLPAYPLEGYRLRWIVYGFDDLPMEQHERELPVIRPGGTATVALAFQERAPKHIEADVMRPTGFSARSALLRFE